MIETAIYCPAQMKRQTFFETKAAVGAQSATTAINNAIIVDLQIAGQHVLETISFTHFCLKE